MTTHRFIRSTCREVLDYAAELHAPDGVEVATRAEPVPHWRHGHGPDLDRSRCWRTRMPGGTVVIWCLEVEPGANGVLAHLSAAPARGPIRRFPPVIPPLALRAWTARELASLARTVELPVRSR